MANISKGMTAEHGQLPGDYTETLAGGAMDYNLEDWLCRFVAYHRSSTTPGALDMSPLDEIIDSLAQGHRRAKEIAQSARSKYGEQLAWIEIETLDRAGQWNAVARFYPEGLE